MISGLLILLEAGCGFAWAMALWPALAGAPGLARVAVASAAGGALTASLSRAVPLPAARAAWIAGGLVWPVLAPRLVLGPGAGLLTGPGPPVAAMVLYLWWRGLTVAAEGTAHAAVRRRVGFIAVAAAILLVLRGWLGGPPHPVAALMVSGVFLGGLAALGLAWRRDQGLPSAGPALAVAAALLLGGLALARLAGAAAPAAGRAVFGWLLTVVQAVVGGIGAAIVFLLAPLMARIFAWLEARGPGLPVETGYGAGPITAEPLPPVDGTVPNLLLWILAGLLVLLLVTGLVVLSRELLRRAAARSAERPGEEREALGEAVLRRRPRARAVRREVPAGEAPGETVRRVYRSVLQLAAAQGRGRQAWETPFELLPRLQAALPGAAGELETISRVYAQCRYREAEPAPEELARVLEAWRAVRREAWTDRARKRGPSRR